MNDYFAGNLARERQADYLREIAHDELVAQARRAAEPSTGRRDTAPELTRPAPTQRRGMVRRVIRLLAAPLLALTIAGPVAADPIDKAQFPHVYVFECADATLEIPVQSPAHATPGWAIDWQAGDTPWLLMAYDVNVDLSDTGDPFSGVTVYTRALPPGLEAKVVGPCTARWQDRTMSVTEAYFLLANQHGVP